MPTHSPAISLVAPAAADALGSPAADAVVVAADADDSSAWFGMAHAARRSARVVVPIWWLRRMISSVRAFAFG